MAAALSMMAATRPQSCSKRMRSAQLPATFHASLGHAGSLQPGQSSMHSRSASVRRCMHHAVCAAASETGIVDRTLFVKVSLAQTSKRLDLSECELETVPAEVLELKDLEELSLAGNLLRELPEKLGALKRLRKLQLSGNRLKELPDSLCGLPQLEGLWIHGNLLKRLPANIGALTALQRLSAVGNHLEELPESLGDLEQLQELELAGNRLRALPESLGRLGLLRKLTLNGNALAALPASMGGLTSLTALALQANELTTLPASISTLAQLQDLNLCDNRLASLPEGALEALPALKALWLYGNELTQLPRGILRALALRELWAEANPLEPECVAGLVAGLAQLPPERKLVVGLDSRQAQGLSGDSIAAAGKRLQVAEIMGEGRGYYKLSRGPEAAGTSDGNGAEGGRAQRALVVSFASAPGVPNWGGLLPRIRKAATEPAHQAFDILYVVDPERSWYNGGDEEGFRFYWDRLAAVTRQYDRVLMLGDSMGATGALLFSPLATAVHAFTPQVDMANASLRPGRDSGWLGRLTQRILSNVEASAADITAHSSTWQHDLDQARLLPKEHVRLQIYSVNTHRLAYYLDAQGQLLPLIRASLLQQMGLPSGHVRLANLL